MDQAPVVAGQPERLREAERVGVEPERGLDVGDREGRDHALHARCLLLSSSRRSGASTPRSANLERSASQMALARACHSAKRAGTPGRSGAPGEVGRASSLRTYTLERKFYCVKPASIVQTTVGPPAAGWRGAMGE